MRKKKQVISPEIHKDIFTYSISIGTYKATVVLVYSAKLTVAQLCTEVYKMHSLPEEGPNNEGGDGAVTLVIPEERLIYMILDKNSDISMLHHECIHIATNLFYLIQTPHTQITDEVFAYLSDTIFTDCYKMLLSNFKIPRKSFLTLN